MYITVHVMFLHMVLFCVQITFLICVLVLWIHKGYFVLKKLVWNVFIKAIWYTNIYYVSELKSECKAANYNILDEASRSTESIPTASNSTYLGHCDQSDTARHYSYTKLGKWKGSGWYRFTGEAGSRQSYLIKKVLHVYNWLKWKRVQRVHYTKICRLVIRE